MRLNDQSQFLNFKLPKFEQEMEGYISVNGRIVEFLTTSKPVN